MVAANIEFICNIMQFIAPASPPEVAGSTDFEVALGIIVESPISLFTTSYKAQNTYVTNTNLESLMKFFSYV